MTATALCRHSNASISIPDSRSSMKKPPPIALGMRIPTKECGITGREAGFAKWATCERRILIQQGAFLTWSEWRSTVLPSMVIAAARFGSVPSIVTMVFAAPARQQGALIITVSRYHLSDSDTA